MRSPRTQAHRGTLEKRIDDQRGQGDLTTAQAEVLHRTRLRGNQAAHDMRGCSEQEMAAAMDVVEHLLTGVYVLPHRANELPLGKKI